jgi:predicted DNA-binding transcriptional regulator YafY
VIPKERYYLPEVSFTPEEMAALFVAAQSGGGDPTAEQAVRKLLYGAEGGVLAGLSGGPLTADGDAAGRRLLAAADAASSQRRVGFGYRTSAGRTGERHVDAFAMVCRGGHWYLIGHDRERDAVRAFRLSRLTTDPHDEGEGVAPPEGFHAADHVQAGPWGVGEPHERAVIAFSSDVAWWATTGLKGAERSSPREDGWIEVVVPLSDVAALAGWVLSFGSDAEAISPEPLRTMVVGRLERAGDA